MTKICFKCQIRPPGGVKSRKILWSKWDHVSGCVGGRIVSLAWNVVCLLTHWPLVQVMAWCRQAQSHYLSQWWPRSMSPNGVIRPQLVNSLRLVITFGINEQNGEYYAGNIFKRILSHEKFNILIQISLKFVPEGPTDHKLTLVQVMACCLFGTKPSRKPTLTCGWLNQLQWHVK